MTADELSAASASHARRDRSEVANRGLLDAIHLATAVRLATAGVLDTVMTYDRRLADGAAHHGLQVVAPA